MKIPDVKIPIYNLIEYIDNLLKHQKVYGIITQMRRIILHSEQFKFKKRVTKSTPADSHTKYEIAEILPLKKVKLVKFQGLNA